MPLVCLNRFLIPCPSAEASGKSKLPNFRIHLLLPSSSWNGCVCSPFMVMMRKPNATYNIRTVSPLPSPKTRSAYGGKRSQSTSRGGQPSISPTSPSKPTTPPSGRCLARSVVLLMSDVIRTEYDVCSTARYSTCGGRARSSKARDASATCSSLPQYVFNGRFDLFVIEHSPT